MEQSEQGAGLIPWRRPFVDNSFFSASADKAGMEFNGYGGLVVGDGSGLG